MSFPQPSERQARILWVSITTLAVVVIVAGIGIMIWGLGQALSLLSPILWPLAFAGALAYLLDPVVTFIQRRGVPLTRAILCVFLMAAVLMLAIGASIVPQLVVETKNLIDNLPRISNDLQQRIERIIVQPPRFLQSVLKLPVTATKATNAVVSTNIDAGVEIGASNLPPVSVAAPITTSSPASQTVETRAVQSATNWLSGLLPKVGSWVFGQVAKVASWLGVFAGLALVPVYTFYFLLEKAAIEKHWMNYLPMTKSGLKDELVFVLKSINGYLIVFFRSQVLVAMCDGVMYTIGFLAIGLQYAVLLGVMATFFTMVPFLGAMLTCGMALIIAVVQYGDFLHPMLVLAVFGVVQFIEGFFIVPKIMGDRVGLHPLTIIIAVIAGTTLLGGVLGGMLAIPMTAALRVLMFRYVWKRKPPAEG